MAVALVGSLGAVVVGGSGAAVSPAWGTGENRTAGNLLIAFVSVTASTASAPSTPSGWTLASSYQTGSAAAAVYCKVAAGGDAAPTFAGTTGAYIVAQLAEFSGLAVSSPLDQSGGMGSTSAEGTGTFAGADKAPGELFLASFAAYFSTAPSPESTTLSSNNVTTLTKAGSNDTTSATRYYEFVYGTTNSNIVADTAHWSIFNTANMSRDAIAGATFALAPSLHPMTLMRGMW